MLPCTPLNIVGVKIMIGQDKIFPDSTMTTDGDLYEVEVYTLKDSTCLITARVSARAIDGTSATWEFKQGAKQIGANDTVLLGIINEVSFKDTGAATWDSGLCISNEDGKLIAIQVQGQASTNINWVFQLDILKVE